MLNLSMKLIFIIWIFFSFMNNIIFYFLNGSGTSVLYKKHGLSHLKYDKTGRPNTFQDSYNFSLHYLDTNTKEKKDPENYEECDFLKLFLKFLNYYWKDPEVPLHHESYSKITRNSFDLFYKDAKKENIIQGNFFPNYDDQTIDLNVNIGFQYNKDQFYQNMQSHDKYFNNEQNSGFSEDEISREVFYKYSLCDRYTNIKGIQKHFQKEKIGFSFVTQEMLPNNKRKKLSQTKTQMWLYYWRHTNDECYEHLNKQQRKITFQRNLIKMKVKQNFNYQRYEIRSLKVFEINVNAKGKSVLEVVDIVQNKKRPKNIKEFKIDTHELRLRKYMRNLTGDPNSISSDIISKSLVIDFSILKENRPYLSNILGVVKCAFLEVILEEDYTLVRVGLQNFKAFDKILDNDGDEDRYLSHIKDKVLKEYKNFLVLKDHAEMFFESKVKKQKNSGWLSKTYSIIGFIWERQPLYYQYSYMSSAQGSNQYFDDTVLETSKNDEISIKKKTYQSTTKKSSKTNKKKQPLNKKMSQENFEKKVFDTINYSLNDSDFYKKNFGKMENKFQGENINFESYKGQFTYYTLGGSFFENNNNERFQQLFQDEQKLVNFPKSILDDLSEAEINQVRMRSMQSKQRRNGNEAYFKTTKLNQNENIGYLKNSLQNNIFLIKDPNYSVTFLIINQGIVMFSTKSKHITLDKIGLRDFDIISGKILSETSQLLFGNEYIYEQYLNQVIQTKAFKHIKFDIVNNTHKVDQFFADSYVRIKDYIGYYKPQKYLERSYNMETDKNLKEGKIDYSIIYVDAVMEDNSIQTYKLRCIKTQDSYRKLFDFLYQIFTSLYQSLLVLIMFPYVYFVVVRIFEIVCTGIQKIFSLLKQYLSGFFNWILQAFSLKKLQETDSGKNLKENLTIENVKELHIKKHTQNQSQTNDQETLTKNLEIPVYTKNIAPKENKDGMLDFTPNDGQSEEEELEKADTFIEESEYSIRRDNQNVNEKDGYFDCISDQNLYSRDIKIRGRITKIEETIHYKNGFRDEKFFSILIIDCSQEPRSVVQAIFLNEIADKFSSILQEGNVYVFFGGEVRLKNAKFNPTKHVIEVIFNRNTTIEFSDDSGLLPMSIIQNKESNENMQEGKFLLENDSQGNVAENDQNSSRNDLDDNDSDFIEENT